MIVGLKMVMQRLFIQQSGKPFTRYSAHKSMRDHEFY